MRAEGAPQAGVGGEPLPRGAASSFTLLTCLTSAWLLCCLSRPGPCPSTLSYPTLLATWLTCLSHCLFWAGSL